MNKPLTAHAVSAYLSRKGHPRGQGIHEGFRATQATVDGQVSVRWAPDYTVVDWPKDRIRDEVKMQLGFLLRTLETRFDVALCPMPEGIGYGWYLTVQDDPIKALPDSQQRAYRQIAEGGENYRYRRITASLNTPRPLTSAEMTPMFSGGLHANTVMALERKGLVKLVSLTPETGRVITL
jgi:transposase InsO family protein